MSCEVATTIPNENAMEKNERKGKEIHVSKQGRGER